MEARADVQGMRPYEPTNAIIITIYDLFVNCRLFINSRKPSYGPSAQRHLESTVLIGIRTSPKRFQAVSVGHIEILNISDIVPAYPGGRRFPGSGPQDITAIRRLYHARPRDIGFPVVR